MSLTSSYQSPAESALTVNCPSFSTRLVTVNLTRHFTELDQPLLRPQDSAHSDIKQPMYGRRPTNFVRFDCYLATSDLWGAHQVGVED